MKQEFYSEIILQIFIKNCLKEINNFSVGLQSFVTKLGLAQISSQSAIINKWMIRISLIAEIEGATLLLP